MRCRTPVGLREAHIPGKLSTNRPARTREQSLGRAWDGGEPTVQKERV
jgi:hypothetical protein